MKQFNEHFDILFDGVVAFTDLKGLRKARKASALGKSLSFTDNQLTHIVIQRFESGHVMVNAPAVFPSKQSCELAVKEWIDAGNEMTWSSHLLESGDTYMMVSLDFVRTKAKTRMAKNTISHIDQALEHYKKAMV